MFDYTEIRDIAEGLIAEFGQAAVLTQDAKSGPDFNQTVVPAHHDVTIVVLNYKKHELAGATIEAGDKKVYLSTQGVTVEPTIKDRLSIEGVAHEIKDITPLSPAGTVVFWEIQVRR